MMIILDVIKVLAHHNNFNLKTCTEINLLTYQRQVLGGLFCQLVCDVGIKVGQVLNVNFQPILVKGVISLQLITDKQCQSIKMTIKCLIDYDSSCRKT